MKNLNTKAAVVQGRDVLPGVDGCIHVEDKETSTGASSREVISTDAWAFLQRLQSYKHPEDESDAFQVIYELRNLFWM